MRVITIFFLKKEGEIQKKKSDLAKCRALGDGERGNKRDPVRKIREQSVHWEGGEVVI